MTGPRETPSDTDTAIGETVPIAGLVGDSSVSDSPAARREPGQAGDGALATVLAGRRGAPAGSRLGNTLVFGWRALLKLKHTPDQFFDVFITPIMLTVIFTYLFGGALAGSPEAYLQFLLPGILVQCVLFTTVYTGFALNTDLSKGVYDRFKSLPIWSPSPLVGALVGETLRYTICAFIVIAIGLILGFRPDTGIAGVVASVVLLNIFAIGVGWIFTTIALTVRSPSTVMTLSWVVLMPLTFVSNVYVDPATMPGWLQALVALNPVTHVTTAIRGIMDGTASIAALSFALVTPVLVTAVFAPIAFALYRRER